MRLNRLTLTCRGQERLGALLANISYEVMPFKRTEDEVVANVPLEIPVTITATEAKGVGATLDLAERLAARGYYVNPHLPARQIRDSAELSAIADRMLAHGIDRAFVIGGDAAVPVGQYADSASLLRALGELGSPLRDIGIGGYPEGHADISDSDLERALEDKAPQASRIVTQMCFSADALGDWACGIASRGVTAPVIVGLPGPVSRQKLIRISAGIGLGQSARFLQKQQGLVRQLLTPGGFNPDRLLRGLAGLEPSAHGNIAGLRMFTFNEIAGTEAWRKRLVESLPSGLGEPITPQERESSQ